MRVALIYDRLAAGKDAPDISPHRELLIDIKVVLESNNHCVEAIPCNHDISEFINALKSFSPDVVFNLCESLFGESRKEAMMASILECFGFVYTGSGPGCLALAQDKNISKSILRQRGLPTPESVVIRDARESENIVRKLMNPRRAEDRTNGLAFPLIVKPVREDASLGIEEESVIFEGMGNLKKRVNFIIENFNQPAIVENFIEGRELNVALLGNLDYEALPFSEILLLRGSRVCGYKAKWVSDSPQYKSTVPKCPSELDEKTAGLVSEIAKKASLSHHCRGYVRVDLRLAQDSTPYVIDLNPNPDLSRNAGFARSAEAGGISYSGLMEGILALGIDKAVPAGFVPDGSRKLFSR